MILSPTDSVQMSGMSRVEVDCGGKGLSMLSTEVKREGGDKMVLHEASYVGRISKGDKQEVNSG